MLRQPGSRLHSNNGVSGHSSTPIILRITGSRLHCPDTYVKSDAFVPYPTMDDYDSDYDDDTGSENDDGFGIDNGDNSSSSSSSSSSQESIYPSSSSSQESSSFSCSSEEEKQYGGAPTKTQLCRIDSLRHKKKRRRLEVPSPQVRDRQVMGLSKPSSLTSTCNVANVAVPNTSTIPRPPCSCQHANPCLIPPYRAPKCVPD